MRNKNAESQATRTDALWPKCGTRIRMRNPLRFRTKAVTKPQSPVRGFGTCPAVRPLGSAVTSERRHGQALARFRATPGKQRDNPGTSIRHDCTRNFGQPGQTLDQLRDNSQKSGQAGRFYRSPDRAWDLGQPVQVSDNDGTTFRKARTTRNKPLLPSRRGQSNRSRPSCRTREFGTIRGKLGSEPRDDSGKSRVGEQTPGAEQRAGSAEEVSTTVHTELTLK